MESGALQQTFSLSSSQIHPLDRKIRAALSASGGSSACDKYLSKGSSIVTSVIACRLKNLRQDLQYHGPRRLGISSASRHL